MWVFTDAADWFDRQRQESDQILDQWVENSQYSVSSMVGASATKALMTFGGGFVDLLRLGDGVKQGTLGGLGTDALRFVAIFPVGKAVSLLRTTRGITAARFVADTGGPNCFWVASAKALRQLHHARNGRLLVSVEDLAKALNMPMNGLWVIPNLATGMGYLQKLGARVGAVSRVNAASDIARLLPRDGSVLMLAVRVMKGNQLVGGHAIYAFRNALGQMRYMDRTVRAAGPGGTPSVYKSIEEIAPMYNASALVPYEAAVIHNLYAKSVLHEAPRLFIPLLGVMAEER
ncbi:hypothetical protein WKI45_14545 [Delftia tsuruhatensis]